MESTLSYDWQFRALKILFYKTCFARDLVVSFHELLRKKADSLQDSFSLTFAAKLIKGFAPYGTLANGTEDILGLSQPLQAKGGRVTSFGRDYIFFFSKIFEISYSSTELPPHMFHFPTFQRSFIRSILPVTFLAMQLNFVAFYWVVFEINSFMSQFAPHFSRPIFTLLWKMSTKLQIHTKQRIRLQSCMFFC